jgi:tRNA 2-thiouridine synthesizing protein E
MAEILGAEVDEEGFLVNLKDWTAEIAVEMAKNDGIDLADENADLYQERWDVLNLLRDYFEEYQIAPAVRVLTKAVGKKMGKKFGILSIFILYSRMVLVSKVVSSLAFQSLPVVSN